MFNKDKKIGYAVKLSKRINQRYRALERKGLQYYSYSYERFKSETNKDFIGDTGYYTQSKKRLETFTDEQLEKYINELERQEKQKNTKLRIARKIKEESFKAIKERLSDVEKEFKVELEKNEREKIISSGLLNIKELDSTQIIEDWIESKSMGISINEFIEKYQFYKDKFVDERQYTKLKRELQSLGGNKK